MSYFSSVLNYDIMLDLALRKVFGRAVEQRERAVLKAMSIQKLLGLECDAANLTASVAIMLDISRPTADGVVADVETGKNRLLRWRTDENDARRKIYDFASGIEDKLLQVENLQQEIAEVILAQKAEPENPIAGRDILNDHSIYFNIIDSKCLVMFQERIAEKKAKHKSERYERKSTQRKAA